MEKVKQQKDAAAQKEMARQLALPARVKLVRLVAVVFDHLLATVSTTGELGTVANWNQHNLPDLLTKPGEELARMLGEPLPAECATHTVIPRPNADHRAHDPHQPGRKRASKTEGNRPAEAPPRAASLCWRQLGERRFARMPLTPVARGVYSVQLPAGAKEDFEYYIQVEPQGGKPVYFPATAPQLNQTVVGLRLSASIFVILCGCGFRGLGNNVSSRSNINERSRRMTYTTSQRKTGQRSQGGSAGRGGTDEGHRRPGRGEGQRSAQPAGRRHSNRPKPPVSGWRKRPSPRRRRRIRPFAIIPTNPSASPLAWGCWSACWSRANRAHGQSRVRASGYIRVAAAAAEDRSRHRAEPAGAVAG